MAKLAGLPDEVTERAKEVLRQLEASAPTSRRDGSWISAILKICRYPRPGELVDKLRAVDPETLTPIEALTLLFELKKLLPAE